MTPIQRHPAARRLAALALGAGCLPASAGEVPTQSPLLAPRPAERVRIATPRARVLGQFFEVDRAADAKPEIARGPAVLTGPTGRRSTVRRVVPVPAAEPIRTTPAADVPHDLPDDSFDGVLPDEFAGETGDAGVVSVAAGPLPPNTPDEYADEPADRSDADTVEPPAPRPLPVVATDPLAVAADEAIAVTAARLLTGAAGGRTNTPWQIGHGVMALREDYTIIADGRRVNALDWLATGPTFKGEGWFERGRFGPKAHPYSGTMYDFEGHPNQILAFLSMSRLPTTFVLRDEAGRPFTIGEWVATAQREVRLNPKEEVTWTLWAFSEYLEPDAAWANARGERWSMERLVAEEVASETNRHACGGTHGLYALASARNAYVQSGRPLRGQWLLAQNKVNRYARLARRLQNADGSFSHAYFKGRKHERDVVARIGSSGHTLEFLMMALPQRELKTAWVRSAVGRVANDLLAGRTEPIGGKAVGGLYHAVHALKLYRERTGGAPTAVPLQTVEGPRRVVR